MKCPKCGGKIPDSRDRCIHWGTWIKADASPKERTEIPTSPVSSGRSADNIPGIQAAEQELKGQKPAALPLSIRCRVEEMLKPGEGRSEELGPSFSIHFGPKKRAERKGKKMISPEALRFLLREE